MVNPIYRLVHGKVKSLAQDHTVSKSGIAGIWIEFPCLQTPLFNPYIDSPGDSLWDKVFTLDLYQLLTCIWFT